MTKRSLQDIANDIASEYNCDVLFYNGPIFRPLDENLIAQCVKRSLRSRLLLLLITEGGDPDPAYRIARCLQDKYEFVSFYVSGYCKSSGTLISLGANELVFSSHGELGPLDIQMTKKDELYERQSGLAVMSALEAIKDKSFNAFEEFFIDIQNNSSGLISTPTASQVSNHLVEAIFAPISKQIDPLHLGEAARSLKIAQQYGVRLISESNVTNMENLERLYTVYPSHGFVIDKGEADLLFKNVREPHPLEVELSEALGKKARHPISKPMGSFEFLTEESRSLESIEGADQHEGGGNEQASKTTIDARDSQSAGESAVAAKKAGRSKHAEKGDAAASRSTNGAASS